MDFKHALVASGFKIDKDVLDALVCDKIVSKTYEYYYEVTNGYLNITKNSLRIAIVSAIDYYLLNDKKYLDSSLKIASGRIKNRLEMANVPTLNWPEKYDDVNLSEKIIKKIKNKFKYNALVIMLMKVVLYIADSNTSNFNLRAYLEELDGDTLYKAIFKCTWLAAFNAVLGRFYLPLFLDIGFANLSTGLLKDSIRDFKQYGELFSCFNYFVGIEQLCGIQSYIEPADKRKYVHDWLLVNKDKRRDIDRELIRAIVRHFFSKKAGYNWSEQLKRISEHPELHLASGSLKIPDKFAIAKDRLRSLRKHGVNVVSKKGLGLLASPREIETAVLDSKIRHDINIASASDYNKVRFIASADVISFIRQKLIYDGLDYRYQNYDMSSIPSFKYKGREYKIGLNAYTGIAQAYVNMCGAGTENAEFMCPTDFGTFDFNPAKSEIFTVINEMSDVSDTTYVYELFAKGQSEGMIKMDGEELGIYEGGLPSGWFLTSALGSILNIYWNVKAMSEVDFSEEVTLNAMGDDSNLAADVSIREYSSYLDKLRDMQLNVHIDKTSFRAVRSEFLRCTNIVPMQYLARCIHSLIQRNEKNASAVFESLQGTKGNIVQILNKYNTAMVRIKHTSTVLFDLAKYELEIERKKCGAKKDIFYTWLSLPNHDGGFGCTWARDYADVSAYGPIDTVVAVVDYSKYRLEYEAPWVAIDRYEDILGMGVLSSKEGLPFKMQWKKKTIITRPGNITKYSRIESSIITRAIMHLRTSSRTPLYGTLGRDSFIYSSRVMEMIRSGIPYKRRVELLKMIGLRSKEAKVVAKMQVVDTNIVPFVLNGMCGSVFCGMLSVLVGASRSMLDCVTNWLYRLRPAQASLFGVCY